MKKAVTLIVTCLFLASLLWGCAVPSLGNGASASASKTAAPADTAAPAEPTEPVESSLTPPELGMVSAGYMHSVFLTPEGTVKGTNYYQNNAVFPAWTDIIAVDSGLLYTVGLRADGTVLCAMNNWPTNVEYEDLYLFAELCMIISEWEDIVAVSSGGHHVLALKADGTVLAAGDNDQGQSDVSKWKDIVAISAGWDHSLGLKKDGTILAHGGNQGGECEVCFLQPETSEHCPNDTSIEVNGARYFQCVICGRLLP